MDAAITERPPLSERLFADLLEALLSGRYAPGDKLPPQRALAAEAGVTMTALREALKRLEQMGLIEVRHGAAMRVRDWRAARRPGRDRPPAAGLRQRSIAGCWPTCWRRAR